MKYLLPFAVLVSILSTPPPRLRAEAVAPQARDPIHDELLKVRTGLIEAYNKNDLEGILSHCHTNVVVTWQNGEVCKGHEEMRKYINRMMTGPDRVVEKLTADPTVDALSTIYHGDTAVSYGRMNDEYTLRDGMHFKMDSKWSATLVKEGDRWLIANFHASTNAFDNSILRLVASKTAWWAGGIGLVAGVVLGLTGAVLLRRRRSSSAMVGK